MEKSLLHGLWFVLGIFAVALLASCDSEKQTADGGTAGGREPDASVPVSEGVLVPYEQVTEKPRIVYQPPITYPEYAARQKLEGKVVVKALVGTHGLVEKVELMESEVAELNEEALYVAGKIKFEPGKVDGIPVKVWVALPFDFRLSEKPEKSLDEPETTSGSAFAIIESAEGRRFEPIPQPAVRKRVDPQYPPAARQQGLEGTVVVSVTVDKEGKVEGAQVIQNVHPLLDEAAREAALNYRFSPPLKDGEPVRASLALPFRFALEE